MTSEDTKHILDILNEQKEFLVSCPEHLALLCAIYATTRRQSLVIIAPDAQSCERISNCLFPLLAGGTDVFRPLRLEQRTVSPYADALEDPMFVASRMRALGVMTFSDCPFALVMEAKQASNLYMPFDVFVEASLRLDRGSSVPMEAIVDLLSKTGYSRTDTVTEVGEFSVRGGILDVFSPFLEEPCRVLFDGDTIEKILVFDRFSQRAQRPLSHFFIVPAWEFYGSEERLRQATIAIRDLQVERRAPQGDIVLESLEEGVMPLGFYGFYSCLYDKLDPITEYIPEDVPVFVLEPETTMANMESTMHALVEEYESLRAEPRLIMPPESLCASASDFFKALESRKNTYSCNIGTMNTVFGYEDDTRFALIKRTEPAKRVLAFVDFVRDITDKGERVLISCPSEEDAKRLKDIVHDAYNLPVEHAGIARLSLFLEPFSGIRTFIAPIEEPFFVPRLGLCVIPSETIFGAKTKSKNKDRRKAQKRFFALQDILVGDLVVHKEHGVGRFLGLEEVEAGEVRHDCLVIEYKGGDKLYCPVERADLVEKFVGGDGGEVALDKLGGKAFKQRKSRAKKQAFEIARKLLEIYAKRMQGKAYAFSPPDADFRAFEARFPYETTRDQEEAIEDILNDMCKETPMDRVVCGDVGFGKTEVAIRAAFKAAMEGKQTAVLVPTTLLCEQHLMTFEERLKDTPVVVEALSRFRSDEEIKDILKRLATGAIDIIIGTHRLLSNDVKFKDLALLIVDEEHKFGVSQKERIREFASSVHTLYLSATPIPRTLHMALSGIRDLSIIATPPRDRLSTKTIVAKESDGIIKEAIERELNRNGRVFFIRPRIEGIEEEAKRVSQIVPYARVAFAHGRLPAETLENTMRAFIRGEVDVLVSTTILQSGIDIPQANTMIVQDANRFGLADLYQLRGRVGRSFVQAYCYFLVKDTNKITDAAQKRLGAIEKYRELASGFNVAVLDMDIRGAGRLFGAEQSGHIETVGYDFFFEMVNDAIKELSMGEVSVRVEPDLRLRVDARISPLYVQSDIERLRLYRRFAGAQDIEELKRLWGEIRDRFGNPPVETKNLFRVVRLKILAREAGISKIVETENTLEMHFAHGYERNMAEIRTNFGPDVEVKGSNLLLVRKDHKDGVERCESLLQFLLNRDKVLVSAARG
jgi:transcription-repair coupling factor (superfamily II helicase)